MPRTTTSGERIAPDIAAYSERTEYLISWESQYSNFSGPFGIFARTLSTANVLGPNVEIRGIWANETVSCSEPAVAASPNGWLIAWEHSRDGMPSYQDIHGRSLFHSRPVRPEQRLECASNGT